MKTPREILLDHHRHAVPNLDRVRTDRVRQIRNSKKTSILNKLFAELILPYRRLWSGLAVTWLFIIAAQVATTSPGEATTPRTHQTAKDDRVLEQLLAEQRQLKNELLGIEVADTRDSGKHHAPDKRSALKTEFVIC